MRRSIAYTFGWNRTKRISTSRTSERKWCSNESLLGASSPYLGPRSMMLLGIFARTLRYSRRAARSRPSGLSETRTSRYGHNMPDAAKPAITLQLRAQSQWLGVAGLRRYAPAGAAGAGALLGAGRAFLAWPRT